MWLAGVGGQEASNQGHSTSGSTTRAQGPQVKALYLEGIYQPEAAQEHAWGL